MIVADVSNNNPGVDVRKLGSAVILKATEGTSFTDALTPSRLADATRHGQAVLLYHFARPGEAVAPQLASYLDAAHGLAGGQYGPPILDLEVTDGETPASVQAWRRAWNAGIDRAYHTGKLHHPGRILYSSPAYIRSVLGDPTDNGGDLLWIAHWGVKEPDVPHGWRHWTLWQFTDAGSLGGFSPLDLSMFAGSAADLRHLGEHAAHLAAATWHWIRYTFIPEHYIPANWAGVWQKLSSDPAAAARLAKRFEAPA